MILLYALLYFLAGGIATGIFANIHKIDPDYDGGNAYFYFFLLVLFTPFTIAYIIVALGFWMGTSVFTHFKKYI